MQRRLLLFLLFHLPLKIVQRLDMPQAFSGDGAEGQRTEKVYEEDFRYVKELSFAERLKLATVAPIIDCGFGVSGQGDYLLHGYDILIFTEQFGIVVVHLPKNILGQFFGQLRHIMAAVPSPRCGIEFGVNGSLLKILNSILFTLVSVRVPSSSFSRRLTSFITLPLITWGVSQST